MATTKFIVRRRNKYPLLDLGKPSDTDSDPFTRLPVKARIVRLGGGTGTFRFIRSSDGNESPELEITHSERAQDPVPRFRLRVPAGGIQTRSVDSSPPPPCNIEQKRRVVNLHALSPITSINMEEFKELELEQNTIVFRARPSKRDRAKSFIKDLIKSRGNTLRPNNINKDLDTELEEPGPKIIIFGGSNPHKRGREKSFIRELLKPRGDTSRPNINKDLGLGPEPQTMVCNVSPYKRDRTKSFVKEFVKPRRDTPRPKIKNRRMTMTGR